ncbi:MAG: hypothetical protein ACKVS8_04730 [Phycisphaerales bacterium]
MLALTAGAAHREVCAQATKPAANPKDAREVLAPPTARKPAGAPADAQAPTAAATSEGWTIVLAGFREADRQAAADASLPKIRAVAGLEGAFVSARPKSVLIGIGRFKDASDPEAQTLLKRVREIVVNGQKVFADAFLAPPTDQTNLGARPEYNLLTAREQFGKRAAATLQVAVYGRRDLANPTPADLAETRRAAEQGAASLRRDGELAFYYHGTRLSMVTVGVFSNEDLKPGASPALEALRKRFPHNLYNGSGIREKTRAGGSAGDLGLQKSEPVAIPER